MSKVTYVEMAPEEVLAELGRKGECEAYMVCGGYMPVVISVLCYEKGGIVYTSDHGYCSRCYKKVEQPKQYREMTHAEIFKAIRCGAVIRFSNGNGIVYNSWNTFDAPMDKYQICYNYTGTDKDVWQKMELEI